MGTIDGCCATDAPTFARLGRPSCCALALDTGVLGAGWRSAGCGGSSNWPHPQRGDLHRRLGFKKAGSSCPRAALKGNELDEIHAPRAAERAACAGVRAHETGRGGGLGVAKLLNVSTGRERCGEPVWQTFRGLGERCGAGEANQSSRARWTPTMADSVTSLAARHGHQRPRLENWAFWLRRRRPAPEVGTMSMIPHCLAAKHKRCPSAADAQTRERKLRC